MLFRSKTKVGPSRTLSVKITGKAGVPSSGVSAVALNVTSTQQGGNGFVTVYPCGALPDTSNLNFQAGGSVPHLVIAPVSAVSWIPAVGVDPAAKAWNSIATAGRSGPTARRIKQDGSRKAATRRGSNALRLLDLQSTP
mgnify:CR=1 FL=1